MRMIRVDDLASNQVVQQALREVINRFLNIKKSTPRAHFRKKLQGKGDLITDLIEYEFLRQPVNDQIVPGILAFEYCGRDELLRLAKQGTDVVFQAIQSLFELDNRSRQLSVDEIRTHAEQMYMQHVLPEDIRLGLLLTPTIGMFVSGYQWDEECATLKWVSASETIVDYRSIDDEWQKKVDEIRGRSETPIISQNSAAAARAKAELHAPPFDFIRDATLRKIFARDYDELHTIKVAGATKSQL